MSRYIPVSSRDNFAEEEKEILAFWHAHKVFQQSLDLRRDKVPYVFYDGPPTANGRPGIHHVLARAYKDLFVRYKQMTGYSVTRKAGWDTHGLPVELEVERSLNISGKKQIEDYGIAEFNKLCKDSVGMYIDEWEQLTDRLGFWLDMDNPYRTYDGTYIESVWWSLKQLWDKGLLYQGYKVTPYCPRCQTTLSSHELSQGYKDHTSDPSVFVKFRLLSDMSPGVPTYMLAWTTTPWTLPGNVALAIHPDEKYDRVRVDNEDLILAHARLEVLDTPYEIQESIRGKDLAWLEYEPLFKDLLPEGRAFVILEAPELVSMEDGTGIVHTAAAYGEADLALCQRHGIAVRHVVGLDGRFLEGQSQYKGLFVKDADARIIDDLDKQGNLYKAGEILHSYPFCWRCDTPLIYYALTSWFIRTTAVKWTRLLHHNESVGWHPSHIRDGRMGNWLETLVDWNISRSRYWGTPLPIWECDSCGEQRCIGSMEEIGVTVNDDMHKPYIDEIILTCPECGGAAHRVPDVIDCWYDSGAMPFAQWHYPFENKDLFEERHPADFICEAIDQTRGWFFSLLAISTLLFDKPAYRNVICLGHVLDSAGKKMSKSRGNTIEPVELFSEYGADAVRWYFYSAVVAGAEYRGGREQVQEIVRRFILTLWNTYSFFITYATIDGYDPLVGLASPVAGRPILDRWCLARLDETVRETRSFLDSYDATAACQRIEKFVEDISKWYVRRSRRRFWKSSSQESDQDKRAAYDTLFTALNTLSVLIAPFMPFMSERIYRNLNGLSKGTSRDSIPLSVHLMDYPMANTADEDKHLIADMERLRRLVEEGLAAREESRLKVRQPLASATILGTPLSEELTMIFAEELNVKNVAYQDSQDEKDHVILDTNITDELRREGLVREISRKVNDLRKRAHLKIDDRITLYIDADGIVAKAVNEYEGHLMAETLSHSIMRQRGDSLESWEGDLQGERCWVE